MPGFFFSKSAMISFQMSVRTPPLLSQKVISPLPEPSSPLSPAPPLPSSPQAVAVSASTEPRATAVAARLLLRMLLFIGRLFSASGSNGDVKSPGSTSACYGGASTRLPTGVRVNSEGDQQ